MTTVLWTYLIRLLNIRDPSTRPPMHSGSVGMTHHMNISVVIPAYNEEKYIGQTLESVISNAPENLLEIIVVNNASTDKTSAIASAFPKVKVVDEPKKGLTRARQAGLNAAQGDVLAYIDA